LKKETTFAVSASYLKKYFNRNNVQLSPDAVELVQVIIQDELELVIKKCHSNKIKRLSSKNISNAKKWYNR
tara:strand:- start:1203 stop:1415 length:213 start_codon:yes stop_codon:yes gene_type:complete